MKAALLAGLVSVAAAAAQAKRTLDGEGGAGTQTVLLIKGGVGFDVNLLSSKPSVHHRASVDQATVDLSTEEKAADDLAKQLSVAEGSAAKVDGEVKSLQEREARVEKSLQAKQHAVDARHAHKKRISGTPTLDSNAGEPTKMLIGVLRSQLKAARATEVQHKMLLSERKRADMLEQKVKDLEKDLLVSNKAWDKAAEEEKKKVEQAKRNEEAAEQDDAHEKQLAEKAKELAKKEEQVAHDALAKAGEEEKVAREALAKADALAQRADNLSQQRAKEEEDAQTAKQFNAAKAADTAAAETNKTKSLNEELQRMSAEQTKLKDALHKLLNVAHKNKRKPAAHPRTAAQSKHQFHTARKMPRATKQHLRRPRASQERSVHLKIRNPRQERDQVTIEPVAVDDNVEDPSSVSGADAVDDAEQADDDNGMQQKQELLRRVAHAEFEKRQLEQADQAANADEVEQQPEQAPPSDPDVDAAFDTGVAPSDNQDATIEVAAEDQQQPDDIVGQVAGQVQQDEQGDLALVPDNGAKPDGVSDEVMTPEAVNSAGAPEVADQSSDASAEAQDGGEDLAAPVAAPSSGTDSEGTPEMSMADAMPQADSE